MFGQISCLTVFVLCIVDLDRLQLTFAIFKKTPPLFFSQVDYFNEEHPYYNYLQQMNGTMPRMNSTSIGVTDIRKHHIYSFYYQNLTR